MSRIVLFVGLLVLASSLGAVSALAQCGQTKVCYTVAAGKTAEDIAAEQDANWHLDEFDCSVTPDAANKRVIVEKIDRATGRTVETKIINVPFDTTGGSPVTTSPHTLELRPSSPPVGNRVPFDLFLSVDGAPEVALQDGTTTIGELAFDVDTVSLSGYTTAVPALGTTYKIVLGLSVLAGALWLIQRRSA